MLVLSTLCSGITGCGEADSKPLPYKTPPRTVGVFDGQWSSGTTSICFVIEHPFPDPPVIHPPTQLVGSVSYTNVTTHGRTLKFEKVAKDGVRMQGTFQISINDVHYAMLTLHPASNELEQSTEMLYRVKQ